MVRHFPADLMSTAAYVIRQFNHDSQPERLTAGYIDAPDIHRTTESASQLALGMRQALTHLASALQRSRTVFGAHTPDAHTIAVAVGALAEAAEAFTVAAQHLRDAHALLADHHANNDGGDPHHPPRKKAPGPRIRAPRPPDHQ